MAAFNNEYYRYGSAEFAPMAAIRRVGLLDQRDDSYFVGFKDGRRLWYHGAGGVLFCAGARGGKARDNLSFNVMTGVLAATAMLILDPKAELLFIAQNQTSDGKFVAAWAPHGAHGLPTARINPCDYLAAASPTLVSDLMVFCENMIPLSGAAQSQFFELRAREFLTAICHTLVRIHGALNLPDLYHTINLIPENGEAWLDFAYKMHTETGFTLSQRIEQEIAASRSDSSGGARGVLSELFKCVAPLADPRLLASVSPPYDVSMADLLRTDRTWQIHLCPPVEMIDIGAPIIRAMFVAGMIHKSRAPQAQRQTWILDEAGQLGKFPLVVKLFTVGAGLGIRPVLVLQSHDQMKQLGPNAETIIPSSAACQIYFAIRDLDTAERVSKMLGTQTLHYDEHLKQGDAEAAKREMAQAAIFGDADPFSVAPRFDHLGYAEGHRSAQGRRLRNPDELINSPPNIGYMFTDDLQGAAIFERRAYFDERSMAGRYHPSPYHPPLDRVRVKTRFGYRWRKVRFGAVPPGFEASPIYADGRYSWIGG